MKTISPRLKTFSYFQRINRRKEDRESNRQRMKALRERQAKGLAEPYKEV